MPLPTVKDPETGQLYRITPKFENWLKYYNDPKEKDTYQNATRSAIKAYNLDEKTQYSYAGKIGHENTKKGKIVAGDYVERHGLTFTKFVGFAVKQMMDTKKETWWDRVGEISGFKEAALNGNVTINNTQINVKVEGQTNWTENFKNFLQSGQQ